MTNKTVADVEGEWVDSDFKSGLIERCKRFWNVPITELPDEMVATYLRQEIATDLMIEEARRRLASGKSDDTEMYDGEMGIARERAIAERKRRS